MKAFIQKNLFRKYRKKILIIYLGWWVFKGLLFVLIKWLID